MHGKDDSERLFCTAACHVTALTGTEPRPDCSACRSHPSTYGHRVPRWCDFARSGRPTAEPKSRGIVNIPATSSCMLHAQHSCTYVCSLNYSSSLVPFHSFPAPPWRPLFLSPGLPSILRTSNHLLH